MIKAREDWRGHETGDMADILSLVRSVSTEMQCNSLRRRHGSEMPNNGVPATPDGTNITTMLIVTHRISRQRLRELSKVPFDAVDLAFAVISIGYALTHRNRM